MFAGSWKLPPENGKLIHNALMSFVGPKGGPVRFRTEKETAELDAVAAVSGVAIDSRTMNQKMADGLIDMVRVAVDDQDSRESSGNRDREATEQETPDAGPHPNARLVSGRVDSGRGLSP
jgi:hypothetical protein